MAKWGILIKVLPWTGLFGIVKVGIHYLGWERWAFDSLTGALFSAAIFVIALMLSGTLADYRASEGMPSQIVSSLESIRDIDLLLTSSYPDADDRSVSNVLSNVLNKILTWLQADGKFEDIDLSLDRLNPILVKILALPDGIIFVNRIQFEQANIRSIWIGESWRQIETRSIDIFLVAQECLKIGLLELCKIQGLVVSSPWIYFL